MGGGGGVTVAGVSRLGDELEFSHTIATTQGEMFFPVKWENREILLKGGEGGV